MKFIRLDNHHITLTDEAYAQIEDLISREWLCGKCYRKFTPANPMVVEDKCNQCFLREDNQGLVFLGLLPGQETHRPEDRTYQFIDRLGYIYLTYSHTDRAERSVYRTIKYHGFPVPESFEGKQLDGYNWHMYGNFRLNIAVVIEYRESYGDKLSVCWIAYKGSELVRLNRREKATQKLLKRARERIEATQNPEGYLVVGARVSQIFDSHLYSVISDIVSAEAE